MLLTTNCKILIIKITSVIYILERKTTIFKIVPYFLQIADTVVPALSRGFTYIDLYLSHP